MPTAAERQAVAFLAAVAVLGGGVRVVQARAFERALTEASVVAGDDSTGDGPAGRAAGAAALERQLEAVEAARAERKQAGKKATGPPAEPIDVNQATAAELDALPRVGPALAARIVASRDSLGPFASLEDLQRVKGIGPSLTKLIAPHVTFSGGFRPLHGTSFPGRPR